MYGSRHNAAAGKTYRQPRQERAHLGTTQHHRQPLRGACARQPLEPRQLDVEHLAVEEQQRLQRLVLCGGAHPALDGEIREKALHLGGCELAGMAAIVKSDITPHPLQVRLLRAQRQVTRAHALTHDREQPLRPLNVHH